MRVATYFVIIGLAACADINTEGLPDTGLDTSEWTIDDIVNLHDLQMAAKNTLSGSHYAYYRTSALDEVSYSRNLFDWNKIRLNGFSFIDVSNINLETSILGYNFSPPFFIAPRREKPAEQAKAQKATSLKPPAPRASSTSHPYLPRSRLEKSLRPPQTNRRSS